MACTMVDLFNENTLFVLFFAMVAIYNYSALKEYQRMAIIYISIYALAALFFLNLFTRPRRFGKTLNSLRVFLKLEQIERCLMVSIFPGTKSCVRNIWESTPLFSCHSKELTAYPLKPQKYRLTELIGVEAERFAFLADSEKLTENERSKYRAIIHLVNGKYSMDEDMLVSSLQTLSQLLCRHYGQKAMILIDEYDVPLDKAFQHGYYKEMVSLIRGLFGQALKTNDDLQFAVLTGCLRVSKESIFTGLNNFKVYAADDVRYDEEFGFTNEGVKKLLANYNLQEHFEKVKEWYDGYHFGDADIYCPWDVINYVDDLVSDPNVQPKSYWINSSGNDLVKRFIEQADITTKDEIEQLIAGNAVEKRIRSDLTYDEIDNSIDNIWSVLFTTGYLTRLGKAENGVYKLIIPNQEVREVFVLKIREWFNQIVANNRASTNKINQGFLEGEAETIQQELTMFLGETIRVFDTKARNEEKEIFYHGILLGILKNYSGWVVKSNRESGDGFADIRLKPKNPDAGIIVELKYVRSLHDLDQACERALEQIEDRRYDTELREDGRNDILAYGIAFCRKRCKVVVKNL